MAEAENTADAKNTLDAGNLPADLKTGIEIIKEVGGLTVEKFQDLELKVETKKDGSPVTEADKGAEELARQLIGEAFPEDGIVGEEFKETAGSSGRTWVIDPIDGTRSFICGVPTYSTLLAMKEAGDNGWKLGIIYIPVFDEIIFAGKGLGCWHIEGKNDAQRVEMSKTAKLKDAKIVASEAGYVPDEIIKNASIFRTWGDGYGYLLLATGKVDAMLDAEHSIWDIAPMYTIIPEAGGRILSWQNSSAGYFNCTLAANESLAKDLGNHLELAP